MRSSKFVIFTRVGIQKSEDHPIRFKKVTLATFHYVDEGDCRKLFATFVLENNHIDRNDLEGEYFTQVSIRLA